MMSNFDIVPLAEPIEQLALMQCYNEDKSMRKINLSIDAYRTEEDKPYVMPVVRKVEIQIAKDVELNHECLPILGNEAFCQAATRLLLGDISIALKEKRALSVQTISGTGALSLGANILSNVLQRTTFYYSDPTSDNHREIFVNMGFKIGKPYKYWNSKTRTFDFASTIKDLEEAPAGAIVIFYMCGHNPTGSDPTKAQWQKIADVMYRRKLLPFFDATFQGIASIELEQDAYAVRFFVEQGFELFVAQSFAINFGLYSERVGNLTVVQKSSETTAAIKSQLTLLVRNLYANPPAFGSRIVATILTDPRYRKEWTDNLKAMAMRIKLMRKSLSDHLKKLGTPGIWDHIVEQVGMFCYTGLNEIHVRILTNEYHIYMMRSGRINMCAINEGNVEYIAKAICAAIKKAP